MYITEKLIYQGLVKDNISKQSTNKTTCHSPSWLGVISCQGVRSPTTCIGSPSMTSPSSSSCDPRISYDFVYINYNQIYFKVLIFSENFHLLLFFSDRVFLNILLRLYRVSNIIPSDGNISKK